MTGKQFSLIDFSLSIVFQKTRYNIPLGGRNSYLGSVSVTKSTDNITKTVDPTGSGVFSFNADNSGTIEIELTQVSDKVKEIIKKIINNYYNVTNNAAWKDTVVDITISKNGKPVITGTSCMLTKMPDLAVQAEVQTRTFSFQCLEIREYPITY